MSRIVITKAVPGELVDELLAGHDVIQGPDGAEWTPEDATPHLAGAEAMVTWGYIRVNGALVDHAPDLAIVANIAVGTDNLDRDALADRGIWATNTPDAFAAPTAEIALALMLGVLRRTGDAERYLRAGHWQRAEPGRWDGRTLAGKVLGLVGFGKIGQETASRALAFGMRVIYHSRRRVAAEVELACRAEWSTLEDLAARADVISLHTPLTPETRHLVDERILRLTRPGAILINTARGRVVDQDALIRALQEGRLAGAGLDVFADEPAVPAELLDLPNVMLLPHVGGAAIEARTAAFRHALENVVAVLAGRPPLSPVNRPANPRKGG
jgi:glyoxylate reductase